MPLVDRPLKRETRLAWQLPEGDLSEADADKLDKGPCNVGLLCGKASGCAVLFVSTRGGQNWLNQQVLPKTPHWFDGFGRFYLFQQPEIALDAVTDISPGVYFWSDGTFAAYPGSMWQDGRSVYWECSPWTVEIAPVPDWLLAHLGGQ